MAIKSGSKSTLNHSKASGCANNLTSATTSLQSDALIMAMLLGKQLDGCAS
jgi:hypothetical protein